MKQKSFGKIWFKFLQWFQFRRKVFKIWRAGKKVGAEYFAGVQRH